MLKITIKCQQWGEICNELQPMKVRPHRQPVISPKRGLNPRGPLFVRQLQLSVA